MEEQDLFEQIHHVLQRLGKESEVTELRVLGTNKGTVSGYFDDLKSMANAAMNYNGKATVCVTLNPVKPALLARAENHLVNWAKQTTSDADIERRSWLLVDFDPVRPSGISATDQEHDAAIKLAQQVGKVLKKQGWPDPILADSGNGAHLLYGIDLPNDDQSTQLLKHVLGVLDLKYSNRHVQVDTTTFNAARVVKLYGTRACKGDDTEDRPHRISNLLKYPQMLECVRLEQLQTMADQLPRIEEPKKKGKVSVKEKDFDLEAWLAKIGMKTRKGRWQNKADKYVPPVCPWNENHKNGSAYLIQFDGGGIAAGCLHQSCAHQNWETLRELLEPDWRNEDEEFESSGEESQADVLIRLGSKAEFFTNDIEEAYAVVVVKGSKKVCKVRSREFKLWLTKLFYEETGKAPGMDAMNQALGVMEMKAMFEGEAHKLYLRVAEEEGVIYYDLADEGWRTVKVTGQGCEILSESPLVFRRTKNMKPQAEPDFKGNMELLLKHVRIKSREDQILYLVYLVSCFIPGIPHVVLVLSGEKGASKSTTMRMTRSIIDPAMRDLLTMPNSKQDLALSLSNNYMPCFDNLDTLSAEKSDMLCMASTGGGFSKRTLYTDDDETILSFERCVGLNGINVVATRADLLDRSIILELERIDESERKEERDVWREFNGDKGAIVGGALSILSQAMSIYPNVTLDRLGRMADFTRWGYAIAEAAGWGGETFLQAYLGNQSRSNEEAIFAHPVAAAVTAFMKTRSKWNGTVATLLDELEHVAFQEKINTNVKSWPKAPNILSRRLKEVLSNLKQTGITLDIRHGGDAKMVRIERMDSPETETSETQPLRVPKKRRIPRQWMGTSSEEPLDLNE
jgi:hypothetical protein